jgi:hypothetical protein
VPMRNLLARLENLERRLTVDAPCHCWAVVHDDEEPPGECTHGLPWFGVIRIRYEERGPTQSAGHSAGRR